MKSLDELMKQAEKDYERLLEWWKKVGSKKG
jgi:CRISPR/Cas system CMR-associated protein Cmr1 (group 7 of RAMP superfamily)